MGVTLSGGGALKRPSGQMTGTTESNGPVTMIKAEMSVVRTKVTFTDNWLKTFSSDYTKGQV